VDNRKHQKNYSVGFLEILCFLKLEVLMIKDYLYFLSSVHFVILIPLFVQLDINEMVPT